MKGQEIKAEERDAIFGEIILEYSIFEEASLKTNSSHWKPYLWRNHPLKAVFLHSIKTRARLHGIQVMMSHYQRFGEQEAQLAQQCQHTSLLHQSTRIGRCAVRRESSLIADADTLVVPAGGMGSNLMNRATNMHLAVTGDVEMITDIGKAPCQMTAAKRLHREVTVTARSAAMNYQEGYLPIVLIETACFHPANG